MFGWRSQGILDILRVEWVQPQGQPKPSNQYVTELQERLTQLADWAGLHPQEAQVMQKQQYNRRVQPRTFLPGDWEKNIIATHN